MTVLGKSNWWFPSWLDRIVPNFSIEGEEWFAERDRKAAEEAATAKEPAAVLAGGEPRAEH
jgi:putative drug exporter of the RND superfamily